MRAWPEICGKLADTREVKALVITGAGDKAFAAGTDIAQFQSFKDGDDGIAYERKMDRILDTIERCAVPTVAAINGFCTGGGAAIAAVCDFRIGTTTAQFGFPIARTLGNCLSMGNYARLAALVGPQRVKEMILLAKLVDAKTALSIGLVSELLPDMAMPCMRAPRNWRRPWPATRRSPCRRRRRRCAGCRRRWATRTSTT